MMNKKLVEFIKNFSIVMMGNVYSIFISVIVTFLIPRSFGKEAYSYFQLENLYCGYVWIMSLGWNDGLYIKFGGEERKNINKSQISSQIAALTCYLSFMGICLAFIFGYAASTNEKRFVLWMALTSVIIEIITISIINIIQATNSMKQYAKIIIFDRSCYMLLVILLLIFRALDFRYLIFADIFSKVFTLCLALFEGRDFLFAEIQDFARIWKDIKELVSIGISISLASYASRLINNIIQLAIENVWGLLTFGKVALTLSISNMFTKFVAAVSAVLFPTLRRTEGQRRVEVYNILNIFLTTVMLGIFCFYLPVKYILEFLLPGYSESLYYMAILLPISLFETKVMMLINTYFKIIRKEREILYCNVTTVCLSVLLAFVGAYVLRGLTFTVGMIVVLLAFRCFLEELRLEKYLPIQSNYCIELLMCIVFIFTSWWIGDIQGTVIYFCIYLIYLYIQRKNIKDALLYVRKIARK